MKVLDVAGTGLAKAKAVVGPIVQALLPAPAARRDPDAAAEIERRARINAAGDARRAERERELFGAGGRWLGRRAGWLDRRR